MLRILLLAIVSSGTSITLLGQDEVIRYYEVNNVLGHNEINLYQIIHLHFIIGAAVAGHGIHFMAIGKRKMAC